MQSEFTLIEAASDGKPKVVGTAYSGGKMKLPGWKYPVVVDLAGMEIPEAVPLLANHENKTGARVGMVTANVANGILGITGEIVSGSDDAKDIIAQCKAGADWQLSIGADVKECELVQSRGREVNGQMHEAPFYHIKKSTLREVSVVAVGADASTRMQVTAQFNLTNTNPIEGEVMSEETKNLNAAGVVNAEPEKHEVTAAAPEVKAEAEVDVAAAASDAAVKAVKAERDRVSAIQSICNGGIPRNRKGSSLRRLDSGSHHQESAGNHPCRASRRQRPHQCEGCAGGR